jgi:hypothetical protein
MSKIKRGQAVWDYRKNGTIGVGTTYIPLPDMQGGHVGSLHIRWPDATTSAVLTVEQSNDPDVLINSTTAGEWIPEADINTAIVSPTGAGAGGTMVHAGNNGAVRSRLKVVAAAVTSLIIWPAGKQ